MKFGSLPQTKIWTSRSVYFVKTVLNEVLAKLFCFKMNFDRVCQLHCLTRRYEAAFKWAVKLKYSDVRFLHFVKVCHECLKIASSFMGTDSNLLNTKTRSIYKIKTHKYKKNCGKELLWLYKLGHSGSRISTQLSKLNYVARRKLITP